MATASPNDAAVLTALAINNKHTQGPISAIHSKPIGLKLLDRLGCALRGPLNYQGPLIALCDAPFEKYYRCLKHCTQICPADRQTPCPLD